MSKFKLDWGHAVVIVLLGFMIFILTLIYIADVSGDLVNENYYEVSLHYQEDDIDARNRASQLKEKPEFIKQANGYNIAFPESIKPDSGSVYLMRGAYKNEDVLLPLELNSRNQVLIPAAKLKEGEYDLMLTWFDEGTSYLIKETIQWSMP